MLYKVKYFIFGEPVTAIVKSDSEENALSILKNKYDEDYNFTLREIESLDISEGIVIRFFE